MSYSVELVNVYRCPECGHRAEIDSIVYEIDPTFNYSTIFRSALGDDGIWMLNGKVARNTIPLLSWAVSTLGTVQDEDTWKPTPGNAGYVLNEMLIAARAWPDAVWHISG